MTDVPRPPKKSSPGAAEERRRRAEEWLDGLSATAGNAPDAAAASPAPEDPAAMLHELRVRQVELEMQNEEMRRAQLEADAQRANYFELFHLAPVGYLTLSDKGAVSDANLTAANLLGVERRQHRILEQTEEPQACELRLQPVDAEPFWAHLEWRPQLAPLRYHLTFTDVHKRVVAEETLRHSEETLRAIIENSFDVIFTLDEEGVFLFVSSAWERHFGYPDSDVLQKSFVPFVHPDDVAPLADYLKRVMSAGKSETSPAYRVKHADGGWRWFVTNGTPYVDAEGARQYIGVGRDISERKQAEEALQQATDRLSLATRAGGVGVWDYDPVNDTLTWDEQMFALYGVTRERFGGAYEAWQAGLHPDDRERGDAEIQMALRGEKEFDTELRVLWPDGTVRIIRALALVQRDASGKPLHMIGANWDITAQKRAEEEIQQRNQELARLNDKLVAEAAALAEANATITRIAATDDLTGLANRRHFYESLEVAVSLARRHASPLALVSLNLDGFARVNDGAGPEAGDEVLATFAALLAALCRSEDLPARLGDGRFGVLLPGIDLGGALSLAERTQAAVRSCQALRQRGVTVSGGVVQWSPDERSGDLLRRAGEALHAAQRDGGDSAASDD